jgi:hypothetical protein
MATHYVDNKHLYQVIIEHKQNIKDAEANGQPKPIIPNYVGHCILLIAKRLSLKPNFVNYSYREEMISDGIENCISYFDNFDPAKSTNPFAYFTQIIYFAFLRRIAKEKKQSYIKGKLIQDMAFDTFELQDHDDDGEFKNAYAAFMQAHSTFDDSFIKSKEKKKKVKDEQSLENFIEEDPKDE